MRSNLLPDESNTQGGAVTQGSAVIAAAGAISPDGHVHGLGTGSGRPATDAALSVVSSVPPPVPDQSLQALRPLSPLGDDEVSGLPPSIRVGSTIILTTVFTVAQGKGLGREGPSNHNVVDWSTWEA